MNYCKLESKDATTQRYAYSCNKSPFATIIMKVNESKYEAEQAVEALKVAPPENNIKINCKD